MSLHGLGFGALFLDPLFANALDLLLAEVASCSNGLVTFFFFLARTFFVRAGLFGEPWHGGNA
jgi:hypothetical protein